MKRYWYIVFQFGSAQGDLYHQAIDKHPADWLAADGSIIIVNQFEITAEEYQRLESLQ